MKKNEPPPYKTLYSFNFLIPLCHNPPLPSPLNIQTNFKILGRDVASFSPIVLKHLLVVALDVFLYS